MAKKKLLLLGGGHAHALFLKLWQAHPLADVAVTLVSPRRQATYSGMLPGYLTGLYSWDEIHIDLESLCRDAGVTLIEGTAIHIDPILRKLRLLNQTILDWDVLSLNIGAEPERDGRGIAVKPMDDFLPKVPLMDQSRSIAIIGGGVGGVELALSLQSRYRGSKPIALIQRGAELIPQAPAGARRSMERLCHERGIHLYLNQSSEGSKAEDYDLILWATPARGPGFLKESGLAVNDQGLVLTDDRFLCVGQDRMFAVGDCAIIPTQVRPRAGVYAVRSAQPLFKNIQHYFQDEPLQQVQLQKKHLILLSTGQGKAMAIRGSLYGEASWLWHLKNWIDRSFIAQFRKT